VQWAVGSGSNRAHSPAASERRAVVGSGVRSQESGVRSQESGVRSQESGVRERSNRGGEFCRKGFVADCIFSDISRGGLCRRTFVAEVHFWRHYSFPCLGGDVSSAAGRTCASARRDLSPAGAFPGRGSRSELSKNVLIRMYSIQLAMSGQGQSWKNRLASGPRSRRPRIRPRRRGRLAALKTRSASAG
jgi:hypothetical protein